MEIDDIAHMTSVSALLRLSRAGGSRRIWEETRAEAEAAGEDQKVTLADSALDEEVVEGVRVRDVSPLHALAASHALVKLLTGWQWIDMRDARERGITWQEIGDATGMTRQGAHDWYKRAIERQEQHVPDFHDTERARAVLPDDDREEQ